MHADGCSEGMIEARGVCRGPEETPCGMQGEVCCGSDYDVRDYGDQCGDGLTCDYGFGDYFSDYASAPAGAFEASAADFGDYASAPVGGPGLLGFGAVGGFAGLGGTCEPCGGAGLQPCASVILSAC